MRDESLPSIKVRRRWRALNTAVLLIAFFAPWLKGCTSMPTISGFQMAIGFPSLLLALLVQPGLAIFPTIGIVGLTVYIVGNASVLSQQPVPRLWLTLSLGVSIIGLFIHLAISAGIDNDYIFSSRPGFDRIAWGYWLTFVALLSSIGLEALERPKQPPDLPPSKEMEISVITSNVSADFLTPAGIPTWDERKLLYAQVLRDAQATLIGLQEVTPRQFQFLQTQLPEFSALTIPVTNPDPDLLTSWQAKYAELGLPDLPSPYEIILFYRADAFVPLTIGHWWLSPTPDRPSIGFGNVAPRVVLWAHMRHRASNHEFLIFNTHIDRRCTHEMVDLCRTKFAAFTTYGTSRIFLGDLNVNPSDSSYALLINDGWRDSHDAGSDPESPTFLSSQPDIPGGRIDHILYRGIGLTPRTWTRLLSPDPERRVSDHDLVHVRFSVD